MEKQFSYDDAKKMDDNSLETFKKEHEQKMIREQMELEAMKLASQFQPYQQYQQQSPREYLHQFLIQAQHAGCHVEGYIEDEIKTMLAELKR